MPGGSIEQRQRDTDVSAAVLLASMSHRRRAENAAAADLVHKVYELVDLRMCADAALHDSGGEPDTVRTERMVECEAAVALSLTRTVTRELITVSKQLEWRLHAVDKAFTAGDLDYSRVRAIALVLAKASDQTVAAIEADILAAALRCNTKALRERVWSCWIAHNETEAREAQKVTETEERCASVTRGNDGMASLFAKMSILEGAECDALIEELVGTVCRHDPRTKKQLRGYALIALVHREEAIACRCEREECPVRGGYSEAKRRPHLLQVMIDIETLLGLNSSPATLADGTVLDPETARLIAEDARWQIYLTEMLDAARAHSATAGRDSQNEADASKAGTHSSVESVDPDSESNSAGAPGGDCAEPGKQRPSGPVPRARRPLERGRIGLPAPLPAAKSTDGVGDPSTPSDSSAIGREIAASESIAALLAAVAANPGLAQGIHPDGHGGKSEPPPGALTYRPSAELVALTRATYCSCTFPGCSVPASRCEIDHVVPFDHDNPLAGGWTISSNLQPLCHYHHQAKTLKLWAAAKLDGDGIFWTSLSGLHRITPSTYGTVMVPETFIHTRAPRLRPAATFSDYVWVYDPCEDAAAHVPDCSEETPSSELYEPTWWETNIGDEFTDWFDLINTESASFVPTLGDIARIKDPQEREDALFLRERFLEHRAVVAAREHFRPPPF